MTGYDWLRFQIYRFYSKPHIWIEKTRLSGEDFPNKTNPLRGRKNLAGCDPPPLFRSTGRNGVSNGFGFPAATHRTEVLPTVELWEHVQLNYGFQSGNHRDSAWFKMGFLEMFALNCSNVPARFQRKGYIDHCILDPKMLRATVSTLFKCFKLVEDTRYSN